jgi:hypothetical protein
LDAFLDELLNYYCQANNYWKTRLSILKIFINIVYEDEESCLDCILLRKGKGLIDFILD